MVNYRIGLLIISLLALGVLYWWQARESGVTRLIFCDVGQGDGMMVMKGGMQIMFDAGPKNGKMVECLGRYLPFWDKKIEMAVISHGDADHDGGLPEVEKNYRIEQILYSDKLGVNDVIKSNEMSFEVLSVGDSRTNEGSVVGLLRYNDFEVLLTGDATAEVEQRLVWRKILSGPVDVLKVAHHGAETATSTELLETIRPKIAVISVGKNSFGHPRTEVLERLLRYGVEVRRTDRQGDIQFGLK